MIKKDYNGAIKYGFSSGQVRALEKRLFSKNMIERLLDAKDFQGKLRILGETKYGHLFQNIETIEELEQAFENALEENYRFLAEVSESRLLVDFFLLKYDYHNLKVIIKAELTGALKKNLIKFATLEFSGKEFARTIAKVKKAYDETGDAAVIDSIIEERYFQHLLLLARQLKSKHLERLVKVQTDLANIKKIARSKSTEEAKEFLNKSPYKIAAELHLFDKVADDIILEMNADIKYQVAGIEVVAAFFMAREYELKTLRLILMGAFRQIFGQSVKERILQVYA